MKNNQESRKKSRNKLYEYNPFLHIFKTAYSSGHPKINMVQLREEDYNYKKILDGQRLS